MTFKNKKGNIAVIAIIILIVVATGGIAGWIFKVKLLPVQKKGEQVQNVENKILFKVAASKVLMQTSPLVKGKQPNDLVEVALPGELFESPEVITALSKQSASWKTPMDAIAADFSAWKADDSQWIIEDFVAEEHNELRESYLDNADIRAKSKKIFESRSERQVLGEIRYDGYVVIIARDSGSTPLLYTFKNTPEGWKRTNALSTDGAFGVVAAAVRDGEMKQVSEKFSSEETAYRNKKYGFQVSVPASWKTYSVQEAVSCPTIKREYADDYYLIKSPVADYNAAGFIINKESLSADYFTSSPLDQVRAQLKGRDDSLYKMTLDQNPGIMEEQRKYEEEMKKYKRLSINGFDVYRKSYEIAGGTQREDNYFVVNGDLMNIYYYASGDNVELMKDMRSVVDETLSR